ncbi:MAG: hypothetical protein GY777_31250 [Candidatus Brocadiaceae bacterium]|nr:hypothetical protein [Candidatus Brocadiaceae bacterium]
MKLRYPILLATLILLFLLGYWVKCQAGINFSESFALSKLIPFKYLQGNDVIALSEPGIIINDAFETRRIIRNWPGLWMREEGKVTRGYDSNGTDNTRCLLISSNSKKSWSCTHNKYVEVQEGDFFSLEGFVRVEGADTSAYLGVTSFDVNKKVIKWNYIQKKAGERGVWTKENDYFVVSEGIGYIQLRLTGSGIGKFRFDDICFRKEGIRAGK